MYKYMAEVVCVSGKRYRDPEVRVEQKKIRDYIVRNVLSDEYEENLITKSVREARLEKPYKAEIFEISDDGSERVVDIVAIPSICGKYGDFLMCYFSPLQKEWCCFYESLFREEQKKIAGLPKYEVFQDGVETPIYSSGICEECIWKIRDHCKESLVSMYRINFEGNPFLECKIYPNEYAPDGIEVMMFPLSTKEGA